MQPNSSSRAWSVLVAALAVAACLGCGSATPSPAPAASATTPVAPLPSSAPTTRPTVGATASPTHRPSATPTPAASSTPTAGSFWSAVVAGLRSARTLEVSVAGARVTYIVQYTPTASASVVAGKRVFVCLGGHAFDGQSGWVQAPGAYSCGVTALQEGFQKSGQPVDSWGSGSGVDESISASVAVVQGGLWRWSYRSVSPLSGDVRAQLTLDPRTLRLRSGSRTDATGAATYAFRYGVTFPTIAVPSR